MLANKKVLALVLILLLTGCGSKEIYSGPHIDYTIDFDEVYTENIDIYMPANAYEIAENGKDYSTPPLEYSFLNEKHYPFLNEYETTYTQKEVSTIDNHIYTNLSYEYNSTNFIKSTYLNRCFEYVNIHEDNEFINVILKGEFRCLYGDKVIINLKGKNLISSNLENNKIELTDYNFNDQVTFTISKVNVNGIGDEIMKIVYIIGGIIIAVASLISIIFNKKMNEN